MESYPTDTCVQLSHQLYPFKYIKRFMFDLNEISRQDSAFSVSAELYFTWCGMVRCIHLVTPDFIARLTLYILGTIQIQMIENLLPYPEPILIGLARDMVPYPSLSVSGYGTISLASQATDMVPYPETLLFYYLCLLLESFVND